MDYGYQGLDKLARVDVHEMNEKAAHMSRTIGQNITARILILTAEIHRLEDVRKQLESGASLLDVRIEDLRQAMNY